MKIVKFLVGILVILFAVTGFLLATVGFVGIATTDENSELFVRYLLYAILGIVMLPNIRS